MPAAVEIAATEAGVRSRAERGRGELRCAVAAGRTVVERLVATSPLRLLNPSNHGSAAWVFAATLGGGLVSGDEVDLQVTCGPGAMCCLGTQSATKVYRSVGGGVCRQRLTATLGRQAVLVVAPDPVVCFAGARYDQRQHLDLPGDAGLLLLEWYTSGRRACGERWAFGTYMSRNEIRVGGRLVLADALRLNPAEGDLDAPERLGEVGCAATLVLVGGRLREPAGDVLAWVGEQPVEAGASLVFSASALAGGAGTVLRVAGDGVESVGRFLRQRLGFMRALLGDDPWERKW